MALLIFWALMGYGMTSILVWGSIFEKQRDWIRRHSKFFGDLISCVLCTGTWVGFFLSITLGGLATRLLDVNWFVSVFYDGIYTAGAVWMINAIIEFFEESRIK
jgi:hypothetical protein